ncbi:hypothetical protein EON64_11380 [archaeon]|nr:MAG: hypothetical protein EON64_11380 [archaeon]
MSSSGRKAGLQTGKEFGTNELLMRRQLDAELSQLAGSGPNREATVYRDKQGRKVDKLSEQLREQEGEAQRKSQIEQAQRDWGAGSVQKKEAQQRAADFAAIAAEPFARTSEDPRLEAQRRLTLRDGDPMAEYLRDKMAKKQRRDPEDTRRPGSASAVPSKPLYKGPNPTPNRFGLRPGYRWDAVDRSNGFEEKVLKRLNEKMSFNEEAYKWSVADL